MIPRRRVSVPSGREFIPQTERSRGPYGILTAPQSQQIWANLNFRFWQHC
jgi:hypothetical protein